MKTIFLNSLKKSYLLILGWGIGLALLGGYLIAFYDTMVEQQGMMDQLIKNMPEELFAFFGGMTDFTKPEGYLSIEFFSYMPLIFGILAALQGSGMLAADEENGSLDLLLAHPVSRAKVFLARFLALIGILLVINGLIWLGFLIALNQSTLESTPLQLLLPFVSLWTFSMLFASLGLVLSMILPSRGAAGMTAGLILVASYFLTSLVNIDNRLQSIERFSPMHYYQSGYALNGINLEWFSGLTAAWIILTFLAWLKFSARDIRVGGEGGWGLPRWMTPSTKPKEAAQK